MRKKIIIILIIINAILLSGCSNKSNEHEETLNNPIVTMEIEDYGTIKIELYPNIAYNTVANFVNLIEDNFYDDNLIHRVQQNFVLQGGDPTGSGSGGPGYTIKGEFALNGHKNDLSHEKGVISMARAQDYDSAGSQFFIVLDDSAKFSLDGKYAAFGKVIEGLEILDKINNEDFEYSYEEMGILKDNLTIKKVTVETFEHEYKVEKIKASN